MLLGLDGAKGAPVNSSKQQLKVGMSGSLVAELALMELLEVQEKRFVVNGPPPADPLLARVHAEVATGKGRRSKGQLRRLDRAVGGVWGVVEDRLVEQRVLGRRQDHVLMFPVLRTPVVDTGAQMKVVQRVRAAAAGNSELDQRTAVLLAMSGPCRLLEVVAPERDGRRHARKRIDEATQMTPVAPVVRAVIQNAQAAASG